MFSVLPREAPEARVAAFRVGPFAPAAENGRHSHLVRRGRVDRRAGRHAGPALRAADGLRAVHGAAIQIVAGEHRLPSGHSGLVREKQLPSRPSSNSPVRPNRSPGPRRVAWPEPERARLFPLSWARHPCRVLRRRDRPLRRALENPASPRHVFPTDEPVRQFQARALLSAQYVLCRTLYRTDSRPDFPKGHPAPREPGCVDRYSYPQTSGCVRSIQEQGLFARNRAVRRRYRALRDATARS